MPQNQKHVVNNNLLSVDSVDRKSDKSGEIRAHTRETQKYFLIGLTQDCFLIPRFYTCIFFILVSII